MTTWITIGLRNLFKNARRSIITALAIGLAFATVNLFSGFAAYMHKGNQNVAIYGQAQGHLVVFKEGYLQKGRQDPGRYLLSSQEVAAIVGHCNSLAAVELATPQLNVNGLLSNGRMSTIFLAQGVVPSARQVFLEHLARSSAASAKPISSRFDGEMMRDDKPEGVAVARDLAKLLGLSVGSYAIAMSTTAEGQMNALDAEVVMLFSAGSEQVNDKFMMVPFSFAQSLYDTDGADRVAILLKDTRETESVRAFLNQALADEGIKVEIRTWQQMSEWYRKVKSLFDTIFQFLFVIVFFIVVMSVINTMGMTVMERTREIGTLRAMGLKRRGVVQLFAVESLLLGCFGSLLGLLFTFAGWGAVQLLKPTWAPPGLSNRFVIWIEWVPSTLVISFIFMLLLCLVASLIPARRAARQNIVDALGHV